MRRRQFIAGLGGAVALPAVVLAQQGDRMRRIGVLSTLAADDPEARAQIEAFLQGLGQLGWTIGRNVRIDYRSGSGNIENHSKIRCRIGRARAGRYSGPGRIDRGAVAASDTQRPDRVPLR
jgi:hypothetical protein